MGLLILLALASLAGVVAMIGLPLFLLRRKPRWVRRSVVAPVAVLSVILGVWIPSEVLMRRAGYQPYARSFPGQFEDNPKLFPWTRPDPELGWTAYPGIRDTNRQGFRDRRDFEALEHAPSKTRVMVLGDSFVWGTAVEANETIPVLLEEALGDGFECFNLGMPGWGIDQMVLGYERFKDAIRPDVVILAFIDDDVRRVIESYRKIQRMNKPCFEVRGGALVPQDSPTGLETFLNRVGTWSVSFGLLLRTVYVHTEGQPVVERFLGDLARETVRMGGRLVVLRIPMSDELTLNAALRRRSMSCQAEAEAAGAQYLDPREEIVRAPGWPADFYAPDLHTTATGNRFLADYLVRHAFGDAGSR
jgi:hypothetical protein